MSLHPTVLWAQRADLLYITIEVTDIEVIVIYIWGSYDLAAAYDLCGTTSCPEERTLFYSIRVDIKLFVFFSLFLSTLQKPEIHFDSQKFSFKGTSKENNNEYAVELEFYGEVDPEVRICIIVVACPHRHISLNIFYNPPSSEIQTKFDCT